MVEDQAKPAMAEQYLDEMIEGEALGDAGYELFTKRFDPDTLKDFGPSRFKKEVLCIKEDLGEYKSREYLGALKGFVDVDDPDKHPNCIRYNWRGIFEKNETLITVGIHEQDGKYVVNETMYR
ncbi:MAG: hypothetical protein V3U65_10940 [Granulosicoccaceae bacterium]